MATAKHRRAHVRRSPDESHSLETKARAHRPWLSTASQRSRLRKSSAVAHIDPGAVIGPAAKNWRRTATAILWTCCILSVPPSLLGSPAAHQATQRSFEIRTRRMDVDVDGAPNAYGPPGKPTLDFLRNAHTLGDMEAPIVGYLTEDDHPDVPVLQGPNDPYPGDYISQTAFTDPERTNERDVSRYVDASRINYVVLGDRARQRGARIGDFVAVHSRRTGRSVYGIVGDAGNPSGDEGSLHLLQDLGYDFHDGRRESVERAGEIVIRFFPASNPRHRFFRSQAALDGAAAALGLSRSFPSAGVKKRGGKTKR